MQPSILRPSMLLCMLVRLSGSSRSRRSDLACKKKWADIYQVQVLFTTKLLPSAFLEPLGKLWMENSDAQPPEKTVIMTQSDVGGFSRSCNGTGRGRGRANREDTGQSATAVPHPLHEKPMTRARVRTRRRPALPGQVPAETATAWWLPAGKKKG